MSDTAYIIFGIITLGLFVYRSWIEYDNLRVLRSPIMILSPAMIFAWPAVMGIFIVWSFYELYKERESCLLK